MSETPTPFLKQVAQAYCDAVSPDELSNYCFVLPNKRSGVFLASYFSEILAQKCGAGILPQIEAINDFVASRHDKIEPSRTELLLILYNAYSKVVSEHVKGVDSDEARKMVDFNRFQFWGEMLLSDFDDVDRDMVDVKQIFKNVANLKEISSNFLTPEQLEVISHYWNTDDVPEPAKDFWKHSVHISEVDKKKEYNGKPNVAGFVKLWQSMNEVYIAYRAELDRLGYITPGLAYRHAAESLKGIGADELPYSRYVFVGFNILSNAEEAIFTRLRDIDIADFCWDNCSPYFSKRANRGARFLRKNLANFPQRFEHVGAPVNHNPHIDVINVPSNLGQARMLPAMLRKLYPKLFSEKYKPLTLVSCDGLKQIIKHKESEHELAAELLDLRNQLIGTAVILPDERMAQPVVNYIPEEINPVNFTMGFSLRNTPVATLISRIVALQMHIRQQRSEQTFFYEDVVSIITNPLVHSIDPAACDSLNNYITAKRIFNLPFDTFNQEPYTSLRPIFEVVGNNSDPKQVLDYLLRLFDYLESSLKRLGNISEADSYEIIDSLSAFEAIDDSEVTSSSSLLGLRYIQAFRMAINELRSLCDKYLAHIVIEDNTVFRMVERLVGNVKVNFAGEPLEGLQVMGVLETRNLDFTNVFMLSMNEQIFPRKHYVRSFIPNALRRGYGMSTTDHQESIYAYIFYRLIARADRVTLLFDGRADHGKTSVVSRYINQIRLQAPKGTLRFINASWPMKYSPSSILSVNKTPRIMALLEVFRSPEMKRCLSASSINNYINCPLSFYLSTIERIYIPDDMVDYMEDSTFGTIIHDAAQALYEEERGNNPEVEIDDALLDRISDEKRIRHHLTRAIRKNYLRLPPDHPEPLYGDSEIYLDIMTQILKTMFIRERDLKRPLWFRMAEVDEKTRLKIGDHTINFNFRIDRVDRTVTEDGRDCIRLIDYKTGSDDIVAPAVENMFKEIGNKHRAKAMLQLMLYANAYAQKEKFAGPIQPMIYQLRKIATEGLNPLNVNKADVTDYHDINNEFIEKMSQVFDDLFDPAVPFTASPSEQHCRYCKFTEICDVEVREDSYNK